MVDAKKTEVGYELPPLIKKISDNTVFSYSMRYGGTYVKLIHVDKNAARKWGFPGLVLQGSQTLNYAYEMLFKVYRDRMIEDSDIEATFIKPVISGEMLTVRGKVKDSEKEDSKTRLTIELWVEDTSGDKVMVGKTLVTV